MTTLEQLQQVFCTNFLAYYHSHVAHVNVVGRTFASDHKLLKGIYQARQAEIDNLAEIIRTLDGFMIDNLQAVIVDATTDDVPVRGSADDMLAHIEFMLTELITQYEILSDISSEEELDHIENYAQEQIMALNRQIWMLRSTLQ